MRPTFHLLAAVIVTGLLTRSAVAYTENDAPASQTVVADTVKASDKAAESTTESSIELRGQHITYTAIAGTLTVGSTDAQDAELGPDGNPLPGSQLAISEPKELQDRTPVAHMFYVAYFKKDPEAEDRPITFFYNGGPGSSSLWLHMGSLGPKHVVTDTDQHLPAAPYKLIDNANSLLDVSDLVFIDMPGTGFGTLVGKDAGKAFWGVDQDANAFARFIARFITKYNRWNSPKYIFGESYGTTRSAVLANILENDDSIDLNGVILLSQIFNAANDIDYVRHNPGVDLPYVLALPTYAATAWYHKKLSPQPPTLDSLLRQVEEFAMGPYSHALALGTDITDAEKQSIAEKLHEYTGLPVTYLLRADLRVGGGEFVKDLLEDKNLTISRLDTRFSGPNLDPLSESALYDPQPPAISSAYVALFNDYVRRELKYGDGLTYKPMVLFANTHWDMTHNGHITTLNVAGDMAEALKTNPRLKIMVNGGYFDLATPFFAVQYEDQHLPISQSLAKNIEYDWYESGHMVYVSEESLKQLHDRVAAFIRSTEAVSN